MSDNEPFARFEWRAVEDKPASREAGRAIYKNVEYCRVIQPQNKNFEFFGPATDQLKKQFAVAYQHFVNQGEKPSNGTPLETVPIFKPADIEGLKACNIKTLEAFAGINPYEVERDYPDFRDLHKQALAYLEAAESKGALAGKYAKALEQLEETNRDLMSVRGALAAAKDELEAMKKAVALTKQKAA